MGELNSKTIILIGPWSPPAGGVAIHIKDLYTNLKHLGFKVKVFGYGDFVAQGDINKIHFSIFSWALFLLKFFLYTSPGDIVHNHLSLYTHSDKYFLRLFLLLIKIKKLRRIETFHDPSLISRFKTFPEITKKYLIRSLVEADRVIVTHKILKKFIYSLGVSKYRISIITPLLPFEFNIAKLDIVDGFMQDHHPIITAVGAFNSLYDLATIIKVFYDIKKEYSKSALIIMKTSFSENRNYKKTIDHLIKKYRDSILILSDIPREEVLYILQKSSVFFRGSKEESFGLCKVESLLMGTPVVCTNSGETEFMNIYQYSNVNDLLNKIIYVLKNKNDKRVKEAQSFYNKMAKENLKEIINLYEFLS